MDAIEDVLPLSLFQKTYSCRSFCACALWPAQPHAFPDRFAPENLSRGWLFPFSNLLGNYHFMRHGRLPATGKFLCTPENTHFIFAARPKRCNQLLLAQLTSFVNFLPPGFLYWGKMPLYAVCLSYSARLWRERFAWWRRLQKHTPQRGGGKPRALKFFREIVHEGRSSRANIFFSSSANLACLIPLSG